MRRPPKLSLHKSRNVWFVKFRGKFFYFTKHKAESEQRYAVWISEHWTPAVSAEIQRKQTRREELGLLELTEAYLSWVRQQHSQKLMKDYRNYLRPLMRYGDITAVARHLRPSDIDVPLMESLKVDMLKAGYAPRSVNHTLKSVSRLLRWGLRMQLLTSAPDLSLVTPARVPAPQPQAGSHRDLLRLLYLARYGDPRLVPWLVVNYLACLRPSELPRLVRQASTHGVDSSGVVQIEGKTTYKTGQPRYVLLSEEALSWLHVAEPHWVHWESYSKRVNKICKSGGPRKLRSWGATHLRQAGVPLPDIRTILGHSEGGAVVHYVERDFAAVRHYLDRITVRPYTVESCM